MTILLAILAGARASAGDPVRKAHPAVGRGYRKSPSPYNRGAPQ